MILEPLTHDDAEEIAALIDRNAGHLARWLPHVAERNSPQAVRAYLDLVAERTRRRLWLDLAVKLSGGIVGSIGLYDVNPIRTRAHAGYWIGEHVARRGITSRSLRALAHYAFAEYEMKRLAVYCAVENHASRAVAERSGFRLTRILPAFLPGPCGPEDAAVYVMRKATERNASTATVS